MEDNPFIADRNQKWLELQDSFDKVTNTLEDGWKRLYQGHQELEAQKESLAKDNGGSHVKDSDILDINAGGQVVRVTRGTLTQVKGSRLEAMFSGRWEKQLHRDSKGRIFLDVNPTCFKCIVDYLNECKIAPPDNPPSLPKADSENQVFLDGLLTAFGLEGPASRIDSLILNDPKHLRALTGFLEEDGHATGLTLLYRGTQDGINNATVFHQKCNNQGPTVTVVKSTQNYIFGGFFDKPWTSSNTDYAPSTKAFLFGLYCCGGTDPVKMKLKANKGCNSAYDSPSYGPTFGGGHDLATMGCYGGLSNLGHTYSIPPGGTRHFFTGAGSGGRFSILEIEVFKVDSTVRRKISPGVEQAPTLDLDALPEEIRSSLKAEEEALFEASSELLELRDAFSKEEAAIQIFCGSNDDKVAFLNVSGCAMAVKHSTLAKYQDSVLYKHFVDRNWNGGAKHSSPKEWNSKQVLKWAKELQGLSEDISGYFQDVTGSELLALDREDIRHLGVKRPGTVALVAKGIQKLCDEDDKNSAALIEQSDYCVGKILDHMRLKVLTDLGVPDPNPPEVREPDRQRFKSIVEYFFPCEESASQFLN